MRERLKTARDGLRRIASGRLFQARGAAVKRRGQKGGAADEGRKPASPEIFYDRRPQKRVWQSSLNEQIFGCRLVSLGISYCIVQHFTSGPRAAISPRIPSALTRRRRNRGHSTASAPCTPRTPVSPERSVDASSSFSASLSCA